MIVTYTVFIHIQVWAQLYAEHCFPQHAESTCVGQFKHKKILNTKLYFWSHALH